MQPETILQIGAFPPALQRVVDAEFRRYTEADLARDPALQRQVRAVLTRSNQAMPAGLLEQLPGLRVIATSGVGYDAIPVAAVRERGVVVTNTPGVLDGAVAEFAVGLLLALLRKIPHADRFVREGDWECNVFPLSTGLADKRVGIVGFGRIGRSIARRLEGFEATLAYCASAKKDDVPYAFYADVTEMAQWADILIVCCPGGEATHHLIDAKVLAALGADGFLVNVSRGSVVDEAALIAALEDGVIRGAALDVFEEEPLRQSPLAQLPNTLLSPHAASATEETRYRMLRLALDNIHRTLAGSAPLTPITS
jgi:lactate dehydrogenase-like 2-hydroxyacid dehydrogenase